MKTIKLKTKKYHNRTLHHKRTINKIKKNKFSMKHRTTRHRVQFGGATSSELTVDGCIATTISELNALEILLSSNVNKDDVNTKNAESLKGTPSFETPDGVYQKLSDTVNKIITKANNNFKNNTEDSAKELYGELCTMLPVINTESVIGLKHKLGLIFIRGISAYIRSLIVNKTESTYPEDAKQNIPFIRQFLNKPKDDVTFQEDNIISAIQGYTLPKAAGAGGGAGTPEGGAGGGAALLTETGGSTGVPGKGNGLGGALTGPAASSGGGETGVKGVPGKGNGLGGRGGRGNGPEGASTGPAASSGGGETGGSTLAAGGETGEEKGAASGGGGAGSLVAVKEENKETYDLFTYDDYKDTMGRLTNSGPSYYKQVKSGCPNSPNYVMKPGDSQTMKSVAQFIWMREKNEDTHTKNDQGPDNSVNGSTDYIERFLKRVYDNLIVQGKQMFKPEVLGQDETAKKLYLFDYKKLFDGLLVFHKNEVLELADITDYMNGTKNLEQIPEQSIEGRPSGDRPSESGSGKNGQSVVRPPLSDQDQQLNNNVQIPVRRLLVGLVPEKQLALRDKIEALVRGL